MPVPATAPASLRERKKAKLKRTIADAAHRLFLERGFECTTLEQVCEEADTSLRTLLRYYPTKEDLALGREIATLDAFRQALEDLPARQSVIEFWREHIRAASEEVDRDDFFKFREFVEATPRVIARLFSLHFEYENLLAEAFAREAGVEPTQDLYGRLLAGTLVAGDRNAGSRWIASGGREDPGRLRGDVIEWTIANFPRRDAAKPVWRQ